MAQGSILDPLLFLIYVNDMFQAADCDLFLYADNFCFMYQNSDVKKIEQTLNNSFSNACDWFVDNKFSIHFGTDKTKRILFYTKKETIERKQYRYGNIH